MGPVPIGIAIHIVIEVARALEASHDHAEAAGDPAHHGVSTTQVLVDYDGTIALADNRDEGEDRVSASYLSPEQVSGSALDRRADVFSLGIVLWELLTGTQLFDRDTEAATSVAILEDPILEVRAVNPDVPPIVAEVLGTALARDKQARFDNVAAFARALAGARASGGITEATAQDVARWVAQRVPRTAPDLGDSVPDLDVPGASRARRSLNVASTSASPPVPPTSVRSAAAAAFSDVALSAPPQKAIPIESMDDDDFDMQIERNLTTSAMPTAMSSPTSSTPGLDRSSGLHAARPSGPHRTSSGLDLGAPQRASARPERSELEEEVGLGARLVGFCGALLVLGLTAGALFQSLHRAGGRPVTSSLPHAFDGTSANESGAIALVSLVVAVALVFVGLRLQPRAWSIVASGGTLLLLALAMVTVTLASTGENPTPPDGALLVPYVAPVAVLLLALGMGVRAGRILGRAHGLRRLGGLPLAAIAGALAFAAFEASRLAAP